MSLETLAQDIAKSAEAEVKALIDEAKEEAKKIVDEAQAQANSCLLYTSDAADE